MQKRVDNTVTKDRFMGVENAIEERVHLKKFRILEKNVAEYMKKEDFAVYKHKVEEVLADVLTRIKPLASSLSVELKADSLRDAFEQSFKGVSKKHDCARDRDAAMSFSRNVLQKCEEMDAMQKKLCREMDDITEIIEMKADMNEINFIHKRLDVMPTQEEVKNVRVELFD